MPPFLLAHLSDPHLGPMPQPRLSELAGKRAIGYFNWRRNRVHHHRRDILAAVLADLKAQRPEHIAVTGDLVNLALPGEFTPALQWLRSVGPPEDVTLVPGNHDTYALGTRTHFARSWADYLRGDGADVATAPTFPFVRRRGPVALIGLSTAVPTPPFMATGQLGAQQLDQLHTLLAQLRTEDCFRVLLIHHPLRSRAGAGHYKRLTDAVALREMIRVHGVELILHGHDHKHSVMWFDGPRQRIPALGVPSASARTDSHSDPAAYNLVRIQRDGAAWHCDLQVRGFTRGGDSIVNLQRERLF